ncbi:MAG: hypothetical protein V2A67_00175, partial [Bacteroidota bacterium]
MKMRLCILFCLFLGAFISGLTQNQVSIQGKIIGLTPGQLEYVSPINGHPYPGFRNPVQWGTEGNFSFQVPMDQPACIVIFYKDNTGIVIAEPGESYQVYFEQTNRGVVFKVSGLNEIGQNLYNTLPAPYQIRNDFCSYGEGDDYLAYAEKVNRKKAEQLAQFKKLLKQKKISESFYQHILIERNCYFSTLLTTFPCYWLYQVSSKTTDEYPAELKQFWKEIMEENPPYDPKNLLSPAWYDYFEYYLEFQKCLGDSADKNAINQAYQNES